MPQQMTDISIDLETLSTQQDAAILSIGAAAFNRDTGEIGDVFYEVIDLDDALQAGHVSGSTLMWWMRQSDSAKRPLFGEGAAFAKVPLAAALQELSAFIRRHDSVRVWGNGATFDISVLEHAYQLFKVQTPWAFWNIRDMRTIVDVAQCHGFDKGLIPFQGTAHNAVDDALHQARVISAAWQTSVVPVLL